VCVLRGAQFEDGDSGHQTGNALFKGKRLELSTPNLARSRHGSMVAAEMCYLPCAAAAGVGPLVALHV